MFQWEVGRWIFLKVKLLRQAGSHAGGRSKGKALHGRASSHRAVCDGLAAVGLWQY